MTRVKIDYSDVKNDIYASVELEDIGRSIEELINKAKELLKEVSK